MITDRQRENISKMSKSDIKELLYICIEALGICDISEACSALGVQRSRIYQLMKSFNTLKIGKHKFIMINVFK